MKEKLILKVKRKNVVEREDVKAKYGNTIKTKKTFHHGDKFPLQEESNDQVLSKRFFKGSYCLPRFLSKLR